MADSVGRYKTIVMAGCVYAVGTTLVALAVPWKNGPLGRNLSSSGSVLSQMIFLFGLMASESLRSRRMRVGSGYQPPKGEYIGAASEAYL